MGLDSVDIVIRIEKELNIAIPNGEASQIFTVGDLHEIAWRHLLKSDNNTKCREEMEFIINDIVADVSGADLPQITPEKRLADDLGID